MNDTSEPDVAEHEHDWIPLPEGMVMGPNVGGKELTLARRNDMQRLIELMGCHHARSEECEHIAAISLFGAAFTATVLDVFVASIRQGPRPITMKGVNDLAMRVRVTMLLSNAEGTR